MVAKGAMRSKGNAAQTLFAACFAAVCGLIRGCSALAAGMKRPQGDMHAAGKSYESVARRSPLSGRCFCGSGWACEQGYRRNVSSNNGLRQREAGTVGTDCAILGGDTDPGPGPQRELPQVL